MLTPDGLDAVLFEMLDPPERDAVQRSVRARVERYIGVKPSPAVWARICRSLDLDDQRLN